MQPSERPPAKVGGALPQAQGVDAEADGGVTVLGHEGQHAAHGAGFAGLSLRGQKIATLSIMSQ